MSASNKVSNLLINATSPYLLQHAYNPVRWMEWGKDALDLAKKEDKPILVSIGYSSCHWCHVMERESFEREEVASVMNDYFICIKVDREERPDIDQVYMEAVQAMGGHGGWPLNVFLTPDQKPFYGGTYFPAANWLHLMKQIHATFLQKRNELEENAEQLTKHLSISDLDRFQVKSELQNFSTKELEQIFSILEGRFDRTWGGMEKAPKFVMPSIWLWLLRYYAISQNPEALSMVRFTLIKMQQGGLYDQLGGGFSRYSVDGRWFAPHFEKMLYDNAQLLSLYSEAYRWTKEPSFKDVVYKTVSWLKKEMMHSQGGFYSALDADSEGVEGKFYTWTYAELEEVLGEETEIVARYFQATREGNWEHGMNILMDTATVASTPAMEKAKQKLLEKRDTRIRPGLDDKILTGWNGMMITGLADAYQAFGERDFLDLAESCVRFLEKNLIGEKKIGRSFKNKRSVTDGYLEDYAFLIQAYLSLYQVTFNEHYLRQAEAWCGHVIKYFLDEKDGYFNFTGSDAEKLIARKKEIFDNVIPGSNSVMATNLYHLGIMLERGDWKELSVRMVSQLSTIITSEPGYLSNWGILAAEIVKGVTELVISGPQAEILRSELAIQPVPFALMMGTTTNSTLPLLRDRISHDGITRIFVCYQNACQLPVLTTYEALEQLKVND